jgi:8-oxo-dGTP diphosphatase
MSTRKKIFLCVDGFLAKDGKIFLTQRNVDPFKGFWGLVGGHVEETESPQAALSREFKEETNLDVIVGNLISDRLEETPDRIKRILTFRIVSAEGEIKLNAESQDYGWFAKVPENTVYEYDKFLIR